MDFELVSELADIEVIAVNVSIRECDSPKPFTEDAAGENSREAHWSGWSMVMFAGPSCIGTRPMASENESSWRRRHP